MINKNSPVPLYHQVAEIIRERIRLGRLKPGDQLPSARDLSKQFEISLMTVRQAVEQLVKEGSVISKHGVGTFIAEPKLTYDLLHLLGFTEKMMQAGEQASSRILELALTIPPEPIREGLALERDSKAVKIVRLRLSHNTPLVLETVYVPVALCPGLEQKDLAIHSLYAVLREDYGLELDWAQQSFEATTANAFEAEVFGIPVGMGMILLEGVTHLSTGTPVEYFKAIYRGDRFKFVLESQRTSGIEGAGMPVVNIAFR